MATTITITINVESAEHARIAMRGLLADSFGAPEAPLPDHSACGEISVDGAAKEGSVGYAAPPAESVASKPKRTRTMKDKAVEPSAETHTPASAETEAQDRADEQAEQKQAAGAVLTHDDLRTAINDYVVAYGIDAAQADGPLLLKGLFGDLVVKISDVPNDQESLKLAITGAKAMLQNNPYKRTLAL